MTTPSPAISKKTFYAIAGAGVALALAVLLFGVLGVGLPSSSRKPATTAAQPTAFSFPIQDETSFRQHSKTYTVRPPDAPDLAFQIDLPPDWEIEAIEQGRNRRILGDLARGHGPFIGVHRPEMIVKAAMLAHEIDAAPWLENYILSHSFILQGAAIAKGPHRAYAAYTYMFEETTRLVKITAQIIGHDIILAQIEAPLDYQNALGFLQNRSLESFRPLSLPAEDTPVETRHAQNLPGFLTFHYPQSWQVTGTRAVAGKDASAQLVSTSPGGSYLGLIRLFVVPRTPKTNLLREGQNLRRFVAEALRMKIESLDDSRDWQGAAEPSTWPFAREETYTVLSTRDGHFAPQELRVITLADEKFYRFFLLLGPKRESDLYTWARNRKALELIAASISP